MIPACPAHTTLPVDGRCRAGLKIYPASDRCVTVQCKRPVSGGANRCSYHDNGFDDYVDGPNGEEGDWERGYTDSDVALFGYVKLLMTNRRKYITSRISTLQGKLIIAETSTSTSSDQVNDLRERITALQEALVSTIGL